MYYEGGRRLDGLFADAAASLVEKNFSGVDAEWWWERRPDGGIAVCQTLEPEAMIQEMAGAFGVEETEVRRVAIRTLGLEGFEPVELVYELGGNESVERMAEELARRSATRAGLAAGIYHELAGALRESVTPREDA